MPRNSLCVLLGELDAASLSEWLTRDLGFDAGNRFGRLQSTPQAGQRFPIPVNFSGDTYKVRDRTAIDPGPVSLLLNPATECVKAGC